jgi:hypothetical protein
MTFFSVITFTLLLFQADPLLQTIKADSTYRTYLDSQNKIKNGLRTKYFILPNNFVQLTQTKLKGVDIELWNKVLQDEGMVNSEEFVKLHFLQLNSMLKVISKYSTQIEKLTPEQKVKLLIEINSY